MVTYHMISESGNRQSNEDSLIFYNDGKSVCAILADGLGGHKDGAVASAVVTKYFGEKYCSHPLVSRGAIAQYIKECQDILLEWQKNFKSQGMKTTMVILMADSVHAVWGHAGDSRIYCFKKNKLIYRTYDHSVPQMLAEAGWIPEKNIRMHPDRNRLLSVVGSKWEKPGYTISDLHPIEEIQAFLLCSDGFWEWINERQMETCLKKSADVKDWLLKMKKIVEKKGKNKEMDNYSAIAIWT